MHLSGGRNHLLTPFFLDYFRFGDGNLPRMTDEYWTNYQQPVTRTKRGQLTTLKLIRCLIGLLMR